MNACLVSVILPVFKTEDFLEELIARIHDSLDGAGYRHEVVCVNDRCPGSSWEVLQKIAYRDVRVTAVDLKENVGQHQAVLIGMHYAIGDFIAVMDADLQDPPEVLPKLVELAGARAIVFAVRRGAHQSKRRMITSRIFKQLLSWIEGVPGDVGMFFVVPKEVKEQLVRRGGRHPFVLAMLGSIDIPKISCPVERQKRKSGQSAYSSWKRWVTGMRALRTVCESRWGRGKGPVIDRSSCVRTLIRGQSRVNP
jgi:glycosyltransferase involved in cell wall biosynthesis